jgi:hypothetical protein
MARIAIDYGRGPEADEFEVSIFGPGYGEAVAVHLGNNHWLLVDSCIEQGSTRPASEAYLDAIGVSPANVTAIVASHWHDDHVRGMSKLVERYSAALLFVPAIFRDTEAVAFIAAYSGLECNGLSRGTTELRKSLEAARSVITVKSRTELLDGPLPTGSRARVLAFSPTDAAFAQFLNHILPYIPRIGGALPIGHAPEISPNVSSIVLHVDLGVDALLLGADLERHKTAGWEAIVSDGWCTGKRKASVIKIAHHGSSTGDHPGIWDGLSRNSPIALLSPFNNGRHMLPLPEDRKRILERTDSAFITSAGSRRPQLPNEQLKRLQDMCTAIAPVNTTFGAVRVGRKIDSQIWETEVFGAATHVRSVA